jgi:uncharacterized membrane protein YbhN (UPF0104 family)
MPRSAVLALRVVAACVLLTLLVLLGRRIDWHQVGAALRHAYLPLVLLAAAVNFVNLACKAARWQVMMRPIARVGFARLYYYLIVSYAASALLPARAGEALRVYLLRRSDDVPIADTIAIVLVEKLFEVLGMLVLVAPLPWLLPLPRWAQVSIAVIAGGGITGLLLVVLLARRMHASVRFAELARGLACMRSPSHVALAVLLSVGSYLVDSIAVWLVLRALAIDVPWATPALVMLGANLAIAVPSTPGQLGALEAGVIAGLSIVGVPVASALAFGLVYHFMQLIPVVLVGITGFGLVAQARAPLSAEAVSS